MELIPPILPSLSHQLEQYLLHPELLPIHDTGPAQQHWARKMCPSNLLHTSNMPLDAVLKVVRDPCTGQVTEFVEQRLTTAGTTGKNSSSMRRAPGPPEESFRGSASNYPFWPGGFDLPEVDIDADIDELDFSPEKLLTCPPGFDHGIDFYKLKLEELSTCPGGDIDLTQTPHTQPPIATTVLNLANVLNQTDDILAMFKEPDKAAESAVKPLHLNSDVDDFHIEDATPVVPISGGSKHNQPRATQWAEMLDAEAPLSDFHQKVPQMAYQWPFELDTFQKQAVLKLEQAESVFVAAHTSAGKTVVAEYAIALSQKHMTRTIYTSPIKALSNQKFRDFKDTFNDVGLVTGDIQINPSATCLIMTTEILRSMLYNGSDIIRDLEWVIFDEVHYINDPERGVVWEEVLILLPDHVNIIMLSATVPNTLEFADWVGRTKKKKIWVISTPKRPVPLEHYLYTGSSGKTRDERFLLQDAAGNFLQSGHNKALIAKKERESKGKQAYGAKGVRDRVGLQQEKGIWITLIDHLQRQDKLPVVAFTLSRNRCDQTANALTSLDLTTNMEKSDIHHFINKCVARLKGPDRKLPQVLTLSELLKRGIGIHHSGILPILKEVVECCFAKGWVKLLYATETFAMGVNMPARTVVFDNIKKHDGKQFRTLLPAEYIQMAGRAGRRGLDSTGTVIILCKNEVFEISELHGMMQGKSTRLESKFRLTYSMILNLLRVEQLRVEDMMKRSFAELDTQKKQETHKERGEELKKELETLPDISSGTYEEVTKFYKLCSEYLECRENIWSLLLSHPVPGKALSAGRVVVINFKGFVNVLGLVLSVDLKSKQRSFLTLLLSPQSQELGNLSINEKSLHGVKDARQDLFLALSDQTVKQADVMSTEHAIVTIYDENIIDITTKTIKIESDKIINDVKKREIPRFRYDPPSQSVATAVQQLIKTTDVMANTTLDILHPVKDYKIQDIDLLTKLQKMFMVRQKIDEQECRFAPDFRDQFTKVFGVMSVKEEMDRCEYLCSEASLSMLPDYHCRIDVLKDLKYVDSNKVVQLKGRVACEMGSNELIITELVFENKLTDRPPEEIAALLSCMVFQQRNCSEPELTKSLREGVDDIKVTAGKVGQVQVDCGLLQPVGDYVESFNFGLVEVVYEWARGMPFADITQLTDVQEGVIVRTIQRLDETLRDVKDAARVIGDPVLYQKMDAASTIIKRDIVFAASLYTQ
eukprot:GFUD01013868.1.p1 GENE.GFUD01013868.1~~GFUD01013868.1.p1  ORF type:complete len:1217 (-),score=318.10 GFUD01013868.1:148-3798(-)